MGRLKRHSLKETNPATSPYSWNRGRNVKQECVTAMTEVRWSRGTQVSSLKHLAHALLRHTTASREDVTAAATSEVNGDIRGLQIPSDPPEKATCHSCSLGSVL